MPLAAASEAALMQSSPDVHAALHAHTPTLTAWDPRGLTVRKVAYCRSPTASVTEQAQSRVHRFAYNVRGREALRWDPRLWALTEAGETVAANTRTLTSLSGAVLRTDSVDAGWTIGLYGEAGQPLQTWDSRGSTHCIGYDPALRTTAVTEQIAGQAPRVLERFTYGDAIDTEAAHNRCGRLIRHDDPAGTRHLPDYGLGGTALTDTRRFLASLDEPDWPEALIERDALLEAESFTSRWRYNALGELSERTDAKGNLQRYAYTVAGQLQESYLQWPGQIREQRLVSDITYDPTGQIVAQTAGNDVTSTYTYDPADGRLLQAQMHKDDGTLLQHFAYAYDPVGNLVQVEDATQAVRYYANRRSDGVSTYAHDTLYQLVEATGSEMAGITMGAGPPELHVQPDPHALVPYTQTYDYDAAGNLIELRHVGDQRYTRQMVVAPASNRSLPKPDLGEADFAASFDANGNLRTLQPGQALRWDGRNRLQGVSPVTRTLGPDDEERYVYDGSQQRTRKLCSTQAQARTHIREVRYLPGLELRTDTATGEVLQVIGLSAGGVNLRALHWESEPPAGLPNDQLRYTLENHLGSSVQELDQYAQRISHEWYYPYGGTAGWSARSEIEAGYKTVRYSGKERDATGLYYYGFRYYAPWLQRWLNPDPAGDIDGSNRYRFVGGNPVVNIDTAGLWVEPTQSLQASLSAFGRESFAALTPAAVQFGVTKGLQYAAGAASATVNLTLTGAGALAGAIPGSYVGFSVMRAAAQKSDHSSLAQLAAGLGGAVIGGALGGLPSVLGYFNNPAYNTDATKQIATLLGAGTREAIAQSVSNFGTTVEWEGEPDPTGVAVSASAHALTLVGNYFASAAVPEAVDKILVSSLVAGTAAATGSATRGGWTNSKLKVPKPEDRNQLKVPEFKKVADAAMLRAAAGNAGHLLSMVVTPLVNSSLDANKINDLVGIWAEKLPSEFRSLLKTDVAQGSSDIRVKGAFASGSYDVTEVPIGITIDRQLPLNPQNFWFPRPSKASVAGLF
jgi:insecticidal toxin complex protein TccC